jgi:hypothetical protein
MEKEAILHDDEEEEGPWLESEYHNFWSNGDAEHWISEMEEYCHDNNIAPESLSFVFFKPEEEVEEPEVDDNEYAACPECGMECVVIITGRLEKAKVKCADCGTQTITDY